MNPSSTEIGKGDRSTVADVLPTGVVAAVLQTAADRHAAFGFLTIDCTRRRDAIAMWQTKLSNCPGVQVSIHPGDRDDRSRTLVRFRIPDPARPTVQYRRDEFRIVHDLDGRLSLRFDPSSGPADEDLNYPLRSIDQLQSVVDGCLHHYQQIAATERRQKLAADLRTRSLEKEISKLQNDHAFEFSVASVASDMLIEILVDDFAPIRLTVQTSRMKQFIQTLPSTLDALIKLARNGIDVRVVRDNIPDYR